MSPHGLSLPEAPTARKIIPLIVGGPASAKSGACSTAVQGGCGSGSSAGLPQHIRDKVHDHPCYSAEAHHHFARMHVAVAPGCNIQCNYCNRKYDCANESRPGVVSEKLTPELAAKKVLAVAARIPQLSVVGVAGPGDALALPEKTFRTFDLIKAAAPDIRLCLSTNGLALPDHVERIKALGVDHVTITINMIDPDIGAQIYPWIFFDHKRWRGVEAARILHERQMLGLEMLVAADVLVKVNSVMIPGINDRHLAEVNEAVKSRGAFLHNIMPLISDAAHGTHFGLTGQRGPTPAELKALQDSCEGEMQMMRHCRQCRADAVGMLGEDRGAEFTSHNIDAIAAETDADSMMEARAAYRSFVERERADQSAATDAAKATVGATGETRLVAVATKGSGRINQHFGHAEEFQVYEISSAGAKFVGHRKVSLYCQGGYDDDEALPGIVEALAGCVAVFVAKIGHCPRKDLTAAGIETVETYAHEYIEASLIDWFAKSMQAHQVNAA
ncbi:nitrogenase cofactor biosynthesis protein NifB [Aromatoleum diolicum]|uniref:FeMo cofactor biosynthesis protein NifB n=1 Tax=Aromatoleum diolicum TaxID=75796 RepID=A0ABX1Q4M2_9RHOO|nr:nitrogenase cofactor biosynthesis protein NifB [Aromatoleum diolicum]NMG73313.1 nitrogenase cofactor biosynthesis protein NifB [Aromatoleum diolicum]